MRLILRAAVAVFFILGTVTGSFAAAYDFNGYWIDVEAWAGSGENETILIVDWNKLDQEANGADIVSESHAFGYRWDGTAYESDMLTAFNDAGILNVTTGYGGGFVNNIGYWDEEDNEVHMHIEEGSWNLASTDDPNNYWGGLDWAGWTGDPTEWDFNTGGTDSELLEDGLFEGINAIMWFGSLPEYADDQLTIPFAAPVPVPAAAWLLGSGLLGLIGMRRRNS